MGIDPGLHNTAWAILDLQLNILDCGLCNQSTSIKGHDAVGRMSRLVHAAVVQIKQNHTPTHAIVETQQYVDKGSKVAVQNLLDLALVSGIAFSECQRFVATEFVDPRIWTKGWQKEVRHNRLRERDYKMTDKQLGLKFGLPALHANHVWDAVGLARWMILDNLRLIKASGP